MKELNEKKYELRFNGFQLNSHVVDQPGRIPLFLFSKRSAGFSVIIPVTSCGLEREFPGRMVYAAGVLFRSAKLYEKNEKWELCHLWYGLELGMYRDDFEILIDVLKEKMKELI